MTLHIAKLCVGAETADDLVAWQQRLLRRPGVDRPFHVTRMFPRRAEEVLDGGSLYWVIKGHFGVRQRIVGLDRITAEDGTSRCAIRFDPELVTVSPWPRRAFQGWRYLTAEDAPPDGDAAGDNGQVLVQQLSELGLL